LKLTCKLVLRSIGAHIFDRSPEESLKSKRIGHRPPWLETDLEPERSGDSVKEAIEGADIEPMLLEREPPERRTCFAGREPRKSELSAEPRRCAVVHRCLSESGEDPPCDLACGFPSKGRRQDPIGRFAGEQEPEKTARQLKRLP
jgi:hypothetical protein